MFYSLKSIIPQTLAKHKIASSIKATLICQETNKIIKDIIGHQPDQKTTAGSIKNKIITIQASSSQIISELQLYETAILERLNKKFPSANIKDLKFFLK